MKTNPITKLLEINESIWLDNLSRKLIDSGFLKRNKIIKQTGGFGPSRRRYYFYQNSISSINFIFGQSLTVRLVRKISNPII